MTTTEMNDTELAPGAKTNLVLIVISVVLLAGNVLLIVQNGHLRSSQNENSQAIDNLSSQLESIGSENSQLRTENDHLQGILADYQEKVRSYQAEIYELCQQANLTSDNVTVLEFETSLSLMVPAVRAITSTDWWGIERLEGYEGIATNLTLEVVPGRGRVLVNTKPLMGEVFQDTAVTAKETAERINGSSLFNYDLIFSIEAGDKVPAVDGPSAGAAMTLLVLSMLEKRTLKPGISLTGTILSNGKIGPIGGVVEKAVAAEAAGATTFIIPKENQYTRTEYYRRIGPISIGPFYREESTEELIKEKTDVVLHLVEDIEDLLEIATYKES